LSVRTSPESDKGYGALEVSTRLCAEAVDLLMLKTDSPLPVRFASFGSEEAFSATGLATFFCFRRIDKIR
jgi:hypothetical protein